MKEETVAPGNHFKQEIENIEPPLAEKSAEQIQAENNLNDAIHENEPNEGAENDQQGHSNDARDNLYGLLSLVPIGLSFSGLKRTAVVWDDKACQGIATAAMPVLRKYAWGARIINFLETGAGIEEMALAAALFPLGMATIKAYKQDTAIIEKEVQAAQAETSQQERANYDAIIDDLPSVFSSNRPL